MPKRQATGFAPSGTGRRRAGVLAHPTSLPGPGGVGAMGPGARGFLDWIAEAGISVWQLLPLNPVGAGHSPYSGPSAFAGNPWLISLRGLVREGWLPAEAIDRAPAWPRNRVDFERVCRWKGELLRDAFEAFRKDDRPELRRELEAFVEDPLRADWLEDWTLFAALKDRYCGRAWSDWDDGLQRRDAAALRAASRELAAAIAYERFIQFAFDRRWRELRAAARLLGVSLLGDLPFYVAHDSADVWAHQRLFRLGADRRPAKLAGVPPDYFSETGQLWGNPVYDWNAMASDSYSWWVRRVRSQLEWVDELRLDHFRAFAAHWEVNAGEETAVEGTWMPGPGRALFDRLGRELGRLPFLAEDLGSITEDVHELRRAVGLPGMRVLQFGFDDGHGEHLPENYGPDTAAYTGTHDNDTARGWFDSLDPERQRRVLRFLRAESGEVPWRMVERVFDSPAGLAVVPLQDLFGLGAEARMNTPAVSEGNWSFRAPAELFEARVSRRVRALAARTGRLPGSPGGEGQVD